jgi:hypothetical protein
MGRYGLRVGAAPFPVEIFNHSTWTLWLPTASALLVALIALGGVLWSNRFALEISRQDRHDARTREFLAWQRDTLLRIGTEVIAASIEAFDAFGRLVYEDKPVSIENIGALDQANRLIKADTASQRLIGAHEAADRCNKLSSAVNSGELMDAALQLKLSYSHDLKEGRDAGKLSTSGSDDDWLSDATKAARAKFNDLTGHISDARNDVGQAIESALLRLQPPQLHRRSWIERIIGRTRGR